MNTPRERNSLLWREQGRKGNKENRDLGFLLTCSVCSILVLLRSHRILLPFQSRRNLSPRQWRHRAGWCRGRPRPTPRGQPPGQSGLWSARSRHCRLILNIVNQVRISKLIKTEVSRHFLKKRYKLLLSHQSFFFFSTMANAFNNSTN